MAQAHPGGHDDERDGRRGTSGEAPARQSIDDADSLALDVAAWDGVPRINLTAACRNCLDAGCFACPEPIARPRAVPELLDSATPGRGALREADGHATMPRELAAVKREIELNVLGTPAPKGSGRAILIAGQARHVASGSDANARALRRWDKAMRSEVERGAYGLFRDVPLEVEIVFRLARPAGHYGTGKNAGVRKARAPARPIAKRDDIDKLARAVLDALTGSLLDDDSRVVTMLLAKVYAAPGQEGARITVREAT